jgi:NAD(P)-dependent dehydrogenase (short-subunit alcohol dehydrogenase family)
MPLAIITGANVGLGFETARGLLAKGFEVIITSRDEIRAKVAVAALEAEFPSAAISSLPLDLSKQSSVDSFSREFSSRFSKWDVLVNNAGAKVLSNYQETDSGIEYHFGVNAVGHFAITLDLLEHRAANSRVVSVSSIVARFAPKQMGPSGTRSEYQPGQSYAASKLANLLFAIELNNRMGSELFSSVAAHPGFARAEPYGPKSTQFFESFLAQSAASGAKPIIDATTKLDLAGGSYLAPRIMELWGEPSIGKLPNSVNRENLLANWKMLEELSGRKLTV